MNSLGASVLSCSVVLSGVCAYKSGWALSEPRFPAPTLIFSVAVLWILFRVLSFLFDRTEPVVVHTPKVGGKHPALGIQRAVATAVEKESFSPCWWLLNSHAQTVFGAVRQRFTKRVHQTPCEREVVVLPDGGTLNLDWYPASLALAPQASSSSSTTSSSNSSSVPTLFIIAGLGSTGTCQYLQSFLTKISGEGWRAVVMLNRGCGSPITTPRFHNGADTEDLNFCANLVRDRLMALGRENRPLLLGVGFSLGANSLVKELGVIGRSGAPNPIDAALLLGCPWDLGKVSEALSRSKYVYSPFYARKMSRLIATSGCVELFGHRKDVDFPRISKSKTLRELDERFVLPLFGYETVEDYYREGSGAAYLDGVRIPLFALGALDDPVSVESAIPFDAAQSNGNVVLMTTKRGGHVGWWAHEGRGVERWVNGFSSAVLAAMRGALLVASESEDNAQ